MALFIKSTGILKACFEKCSTSVDWLAQPWMFEKGAILPEELTASFSAFTGKIKELKVRENMLNICIEEQTTKILANFFVLPNYAKRLNYRSLIGSPATISPDSLNWNCKGVHRHFDKKGVKIIKTEEKKKSVKKNEGDEKIDIPFTELKKDDRGRPYQEKVFTWGLGRVISITCLQEDKKWLVTLRYQRNKKRSFLCNFDDLMEEQEEQIKELVDKQVCITSSYLTIEKR